MMTDLAEESGFLSHDRCSSETDLSGVGIRPRTCSNLSQYANRRRRKSRGHSATSVKLPTEFLPPRGRPEQENGSEVESINMSVDETLSNEHLESNGTCPVSPTREEVKAQAFERLQDELRKAQEELKLKDEQCEKLARVRTELESELEDLTASLFQEAHAMVRAAKVKQVGAEKRLREANNKVDLLQAEVTALKALVISSTPNRSTGKWRRHSSEHLSPCPECGLFDCDAAGVNRVASNDHSTLQTPQTLDDEAEVDVISFKEFLDWMDERSVAHDQPFMVRICQEDVAPCLKFPNKDLALAVHSAIENNTLMMEVISGEAVFRKCALTRMSRFCQHRVKLSERDEWFYLSRSSRDRIVAVCNFYTYVRYIQGGLVKLDATEIYWQIMRRRGEMAVARLGLAFKHQK